MNKELIPVVQVVLASVATYFLTKSQYKKKEQLEAYKAQLQYIYKPLFAAIRHFKYDEKIDREELISLCELYFEIEDNHLDLIDPRLEFLMWYMYGAILNNNSSVIDKSDTIYHHISLQYEYLKKKLSLPHSNIIYLLVLRRVKTKDALIKAITPSNKVMLIMAFFLWCLALLIPYLADYIKPFFQ